MKIRQRFLKTSSEFELLDSSRTELIQIKKGDKQSRVAQLSDV